MRPAKILLAVIPLLLLIQASPVGAAQPAPQSIVIAGQVSATDGTAIAGATVFVNDRQFTTDERGHWAGSVRYVPVLNEYVSANGFVENSYATIQLDSRHLGGLLLHDTLRSIFAPDVDRYLRMSILPPTIDQFDPDSGPARSQELPAEARSVTLSGSAGNRDGQPVVASVAFVSRPDDFVDEVPVDIQSGTFSATFPLSYGVGKYRVELDDTFGGAVLNVPLYVGVAYAAQLPIWPADADLTGDGPTTRAFAAIQNIRLGHGLNALIRDERLDQVAQDHVNDMLAQNWICHCWSDGSTFGDRVIAAGVTPVRNPVPGRPSAFTLAIGNSIATLPGAAGVQGLFDSPGHRSDMLGDYSHVGLAYGGRLDDGTARLSVVYALEEPS